MIVGATGFEPAAAWSQTRSATGLRYTPLHIQQLLALFLNCECKGSTYFWNYQIFLCFFYQEVHLFLKQRSYDIPRIYVIAWKTISYIYLCLHRTKYYRKIHSMIVCFISIQIYFLKGIETKSLANKEFQNEDKYQSQNQLLVISYFSYVDNVSLYIIIC